MSWLLKVTHMWVAFFKLLDKKFFERRRRWATREKETKANAKNRKKASKPQRRSGSKKKTKRNRLGQLEDKRRAKR